MAVLMAGAPVWLVMFYQAVSLFFAHFLHANIKIPVLFDTIMGFVFVSPSLHRVHHHFKLPYSDKNYGNMFSFWDRIFGSFAKLPISEIIYGLDTYMKHEEHSNLLTMLKLPFGKYRKPT